MVPAERQFFTFVGILITIAIVLYGLSVGLEDVPSFRYHAKKKMEGLGLIYTMVFALSSGMLNYLGFTRLENFLLLHISDRSLATVISASIVIFFCFLYSSLLKKILEVFFHVQSIPHSLESSLAGYVIGRLLLIGGLASGMV